MSSIDPNNGRPRLVSTMVNVVKQNNYTGIGKTTLAKEICIRWARDEFLADEFDTIILIPLRSVQQRSFKEVMVEHVGEINYQKLDKSAGSRCLLILEGLDEMAINHRQNDHVLRRLIENTLLEKAKILITSRPHVCENLIASRTIEVVGFGDKEIRKFVEYSFCNDAGSIEEFMRQLTEYPQLQSLCYVPLNLVMIIDIFCFSQNRLPSTLTELYRLFIVMILQREIMKGNVNKLPVACNVIGESLSKLLIDKGIPKEAVVVHLLCKLAYNAFFESYSNETKGIKRWKEPKIIFTESDLTESGIQITSDFDRFGLLKATHTHHIPRDTVTYNFLHLSVQEFLCSLYMSTLSQQEQIINLLSECFEDYPNVFTFFCGLTGLASSRMYKFVSSQLSSSNVITALRCIYESNHNDPVKFTSPLTLNMSGKTLLPYDCLCLSWLLSCYPVSELKMDFCPIEDIGAKLLVRYYPNNNTTGQLLEVLNLHRNNFAIAGLRNIMQVVRTSKLLL